MTRKDYVLIAAALLISKPANAKTLVEMGCDEQHIDDCYAIADALAKDNPRFDRERFLRACGVAS